MKLPDKVWICRVAGQDSQHQLVLHARIMMPIQQQHLLLLRVVWAATLDILVRCLTPPVLHLTLETSELNLLFFYMLIKLSCSAD